MINLFVNDIAPERIRSLNEKPIGNGPVVYWMNRDLRLEDNWALLTAYSWAVENKQPLAVVFNLNDKSGGPITLRQADFMLKGLQQVSDDAQHLNIPFFLLNGDPVTNITAFSQYNQCGLIITDVNPLRDVRSWQTSIADSLPFAVQLVDAHNIIPVWEASDKQEYAARTIRPKLRKKLDKFLVDFPKLKPFPYPWPGDQNPVYWEALPSVMMVDPAVEPVNWLEPGSKAGGKVLEKFMWERLKEYHTGRNDPALHVLSNLSPYLHFGQLSPQRVALEITDIPDYDDSRAAFLEELIIRRELADNFCWYNDQYDQFHGFPDWAQSTLNMHRYDEREYIYSPEQFESANTHDMIWNAAQLELRHQGKVHGYMRMYWAKKILEWSPEPETALSTAIHLNDRFSIDGRDPNGYTGIAWSLGGVHDRPWFERPVFGKIRYMNANGLRRKFQIQEYVDRFRDYL